MIFIAIAFDYRRIIESIPILKFDLYKIAFSKRKLCNGENFQIKDFDEFRCFLGSLVRIMGFKKMYV